MQIVNRIIRVVTTYAWTVAFGLVIGNVLTPLFIVLSIALVGNVVSAIVVAYVVKEQAKKIDAAQAELAEKLRDGGAEFAQTTELHPDF